MNLHGGDKACVQGGAKITFFKAMVKMNGYIDLNETQTICVGHN
jgi:hypothetical protein